MKIAQNEIAFVLDAEIVFDNLHRHICRPIK